jgi:hypothetical protein
MIQKVHKLFLLFFAMSKSKRKQEAYTKAIYSDWMVISEDMFFEIRRLEAKRLNID